MEVVMSQQKCGGQGADCTGKTGMLFVLSLVFMVATSALYGGLLGAPASIFMYLFMPEMFESFGQALFTVCAAAAALLLAITVLSRLVHVMLEGSSYLRDTFYYEFIGQ